jgi:hypothetical protein
MELDGVRCRSLGSTAPFIFNEPVYIVLGLHNYRCQQRHTCRAELREQRCNCCRVSE